MDPDYVEEYLNAMKVATKKYIKSKAMARKFLYELGMIDKKGNLTKKYQSNKNGNK